MSHTYIHNGAIIDGNGGPPIRSGAVLVRDNRIEATGPAGDVARPPEAAIVDAAGGTILPGFIDAHVHLTFESVNFARNVGKPFSLTFYETAHYMRRTLEAGITTVCDAGGADLGIKTAVEQGLVPGPRIQISISVLTITGGHADFWMPSGARLELIPPYPGNPGASLICDGVEDVQRKVRQVLRAGAEVIKICATGGVASPTDHPTFTQFTPEELAAVVQEGRYRGGIKVMAHAQGAAGIKNAVRAGIHSTEHGIFLDDEAIDLMLEKGTFLVPTLVAPVGVLETAEAGGDLLPQVIQKARETIGIHSENIGRAFKAGVRIAMGTDAGVIPHGTNLRELGLMAAAGMSPMDVIVATTKRAAQCLGWDDRLGTLEVGKLADVIIARTDPLQDLRSLENRDNILLVMKDGRIEKDLRVQTQ